jgi:hypothetical protein
MQKSAEQSFPFLLPILRELQRSLGIVFHAAQLAHYCDWVCLAGHFLDGWVLQYG